jgi:L-asparagine oxygenase
MGIYVHKTVVPRLERKIPPTPTTDEEADGMLDSMRETIANFLDVVLRYGSVVGYAQEQDGRLLQHVFPKRAHEARQIAGSSRAELALHTETAFHPYRPDYVALMCVRGDASAATVYSSLGEVLPELSTPALNELYQPHFVTSVDESFRARGESDQVVGPLPVLRLDKWGKRTLVFDAELMSGTTPLAAEALSELKFSAAAKAREVTLEAGDIVVIDNRTTVHGRRPFTPRYDGTDRWLLRALLREELPPASDYEGGVITTTDFRKVVV